MSLARNGRAKQAGSRGGNSARPAQAGRTADRYLQPGEKAIEPDYSSPWVKASLERTHLTPSVRPDARCTDNSKEARAGQAAERRDSAKTAARAKLVKDLLKKNLEVSLEACRQLVESNMNLNPHSHSEQSPSLSADNRPTILSKTRSSSVGRRAELNSRANRVGILKPADFKSMKNPKAVLRRRKVSTGTAGSQKFLDKRPKQSSSEERAVSEENSAESQPLDLPAEVEDDRASRMQKTGRARGRPRLQPAATKQSKKQEKKKRQTRVRAIKADSTAERSKRTRKPSIR